MSNFNPDFLTKILKINLSGEVWLMATVKARHSMNSVPGQSIHWIVSLSGDAIKCSGHYLRKYGKWTKILTLYCDLLTKVDFVISDARTLLSKVHIFRGGHKILWNLHRRFVLCSPSQIYSRDFVAFSECKSFTRDSTVWYFQELRFSFWSKKR